MNRIALLEQDTIDRIAAGEVVERPASVVKELVENAIDAGANTLTVEIRDGGLSLIRITDNGCGIPAEEVRTAFLRHATSKIRTVDDLLTAGTLGFRGEALSSIAAVSQVETITKTAEGLLGVRYVIEGGKEKELEEIGAPQGTTFLVRSLFYNTPARKKFLKSAVTEAGYVSSLIERLALSHPNVSFRLIINRDIRLQTSGNGKAKDIVYNAFGREIAANVVPVEAEADGIRITGLIGKPAISRGNRNYENYFVNGRYIRNAVISKAIEEAYQPFLMSHRYPFTALMLQIDPELVDVNVHPAKLEVRFSDQNGIYSQVYQTVKEGLLHRELIPEFTVGKPHTEQEAEKTGAQKADAGLQMPERPEAVSRAASRPASDAAEDRGVPRQCGQKPFETLRRELLAESVSPYEPKYPGHPSHLAQHKPVLRPVTGTVTNHPAGDRPAEETDEKSGSLQSPAITADAEDLSRPAGAPHQQELFEDRLLDPENAARHRLIGQLFDTYWIVEFQDKMYLIDQHAAHEKVMYERFLRNLKEKKQTSQMISPPVIVTLSVQEEEMLRRHMDRFQEMGFEIEPFGGHEYSICAVPGNLYGIADRTLFVEILDGLTDVSEHASQQAVLEKLASMACKAAVKGKHKLQPAEADALIRELLSLENPYNCPHGRPTIIAMTKYELEKKFGRIV